MRSRARSPLTADVYAASGGEFVGRSRCARAGGPDGRGCSGAVRLLLLVPCARHGGRSAFVARRTAEQPRNVQRQQPHQHDRKWRKRQTRRERYYDVTGAERPVPQHVVTSGEHSHESQRPVRHAQKLRGRRRRTYRRHMIAAAMASISSGESIVEASAVFAPGLLSGQIALVTGGGTGLGRATAIELARCGATVTISGRRANVLEAAAAEIGGTQATDWMAADIREPHDAQRLLESVLERHGRLDLLVNNAGGQYFAPAEAITAKGWRAVWALNVEGMLNMAETAFELAMRPAGAGKIVNVTLSPHHGMPGMAHSGAARATVEALTRELALRWAADGVTVSAVAAGHFDTDAMGKYPDIVRAGMARSVPLGRLGSVREHAWLVALLASPLAQAFSGSTVTLDGSRDNWFGSWPPAGMADSAGEVPTEARKRAHGGGV
jgi:citronellol/citronellal dehydrogenase